MGKKSDARAIEIATRREQSLQFRRAGLSLRDIAARLNVDPKTIHEDIRVMLAEAIKENVDSAEQLRALEIERLDRMLLSLSPMLNPAAFPGQKAPLPDLKAIDRALRISEHRAKLLGLYAPEKREHSGTVNMTWAQMLAEARKDL